MIGSRRKVINNFSALLNEGVSRKALEEVAAPIGLDLGGQKPEEIALSIMAQLVAAENGGTGKPLEQVFKNEFFVNRAVFLTLADATGTVPGAFLWCKGSSW
ncbi:hypothetical protein SSCH_1050011 [Syntrophaceticus schinkii]|uniref:XdhC Rossmann domain-containing protein n=1 Tax=Syntrophaceticus schinkii TaxID=499207 RepID=A0A0B7MHK0_9FIRM|nr:hypothetical protein SSCH_1050011 [Syntrophaceticus schinkii]